MKIERPLAKQIDDPLLEIVLEVFAIVVKSDEVVSDAEIEYVRDYLNRNYLRFSEQLFSFFEQLCGDGISVSGLLDEVAKNTSSMEIHNKVFIVLKAFELALVDNLKPSEVELIKALSKRMGFSDHNYREIALIGKCEGKLESQDHDDLRLCTLNTGSFDGQFSTVDLEGGPGFNIVYCCGRIYIRPCSENSNLRLNNRTLSKARFVNVSNGDLVHIEKNILQFSDLLTYFRLTYRPNFTSRIFVGSPPEWKVQEEWWAGADFEIVFEFAKITLKSVFNNRLRLNGEPSKSGMTIHLFDELSVYGYPIRVARILELSNWEEAKLSDTKATMSISNNPWSELHLEDFANQSWKISVTKKGNSVLIDKRDCPYFVQCNGVKVEKSAEVLVPFNLLIADESFRVLNDGSSVRVKKSSKVVESFEVKNLRKKIGKKYFLTDISLKAYAGDLVAVLGSSGAGKSTFFKALLGLTSCEGEIKYFDGSGAPVEFTPSYVPQDELLFMRHSVEENLRIRAELIYPNHSVVYKNNLVKKVLHEIELYKHRSTKVGSNTSNILSGGERKRLNIGLELISNSPVIFLDEPTSGLSSQDALKITRVLCQRSQSGSIIFSVLHQPNEELLRYYNKVCVIDIGGRLAFYGNFFDGRSFFEEALKETVGEHFIQKDNDADFFLHSLNYPSTRIDGSNSDSRRFPDDFWQKRFRESNFLTNQYKTKKYEIDTINSTV